MVDEALRTLRTLFLASLAVLLLWFLTWPAAVEKLRHYEEARDLEAWILLRDFFRNPDLDVFELGLDETIEYFLVERPPESPQGSESFEQVDLVIESAWPSQDRYAIRLEPETAFAERDPDTAEYARIYRVEAAPGEIPLAAYEIVFAENDRFVIPANDPGFREASRRGLRHLMRTAASRFHPASWSSVAIRLRDHGFSGDAPALRATDQAVARLKQASDPRIPSSGIRVFGMDLSISVFFFGVGLLLAAIGFACIGPLVRIRHSDARSTQAWVMSLPQAPGVAGWALETLILLVSAAWSLAPVAVLVLQLRSGIDLELRENPALVIGGAGLAFAAAVFAATSLELRRVRRAGRAA